jgi:hypothetical protein
MTVHSLWYWSLGDEMDGGGLRDGFHGAATIDDGGCVYLLLHMVHLFVVESLVMASLWSYGAVLCYNIDIPLVWWINQLHE